MPTTRPIDELLKSVRGTVDDKRRNEIALARLDELIPHDLLDDILVELEDMACEGEDAERMVREIALEVEFIKADQDWKYPNTDEKLKVISAIRKSASDLKELLDFEFRNGNLLELHGHLNQFINPDASDSKDRYFDEPRFDPRTGAMGMERLNKLSEDLHALANACDSVHGFQDQVLRPINKGARMKSHDLIAFFLWEQCHSGILKPIHPSSEKGPMARLFNMMCLLAGIPEKNNPVNCLDKMKKMFKHNG